MRKGIDAIEASNFGYASPLMANLLVPMKEAVAEFYKPVLSYNPELNRTEGFSEGASYYLLTHMGFIKDKQLQQEIKFR